MNFCSLISIYEYNILQATSHLVEMVTNYYFTDKKSRVTKRKRDTEINIGTTKHTGEELGRTALT